MSDLINGLRHMADDHPCCRETLQLTIDTIEVLERENTSLRCLAIEQQKAIKRLLCTMKAARHVEGQLKDENATLRSLLRGAITEHVDPYDLPEGDHYIARAKTVLGIPPTQEAVTAARKEAKP